MAKKLDTGRSDQDTGNSVLKELQRIGKALEAIGVQLEMAGLAEACDAIRALAARAAAVLPPQKPVRRTGAGSKKAAGK